MASGTAHSSVIIVVVLLSFVVCCIAACKCVDPPTICTGNFAVRGRITSSVGNQTEHDDITYTVDVLDVLRHPASRHAEMPVANISSLTITTGSHSCGYPDLETGEIYFIAGDFHAPSLYELAKCGGLVSRYDANGELPSYLMDDVSTCSASATVFSSLIFVVTVFVSYFLK